MNEEILDILKCIPTRGDDLIKTGGIYFPNFSLCVSSSDKVKAKNTKIELHKIADNMTGTVENGSNNK